LAVGSSCARIEPAPDVARLDAPRSVKMITESSVQAAPAGPVPPAPLKKATRQWQERLLPVMTGILVGLTIFFFVATFVQLAFLYTNILQIPEPVIAPSGEITLPENLTPAQQLAARETEYAARLEAYTLARRYHQAGIWAISSLWLRYLGFVTGMILALVGASFVLGKLQEEPSQLEGKVSALSFSFQSASPGIILAALGVLLMFGNILDHDELALTDKQIYFPPGAPAASVGSASSTESPEPALQYIPTETAVPQK
jgi:hypothetical protein